MEEYKLSIANLICDTAIDKFKNQNVSDEVIIDDIRAMLNDLYLDVEDWAEPISKSLNGEKTNMPIYMVLSYYGYEKASKINPNPTFSQVWVEINDFIKYFNLMIYNEVYFKMESFVDDLTKNAIKVGYSWDKRIVSRFIVKKGYENALKISNNPDEDLIKESAFKILAEMFGFGNPGLLFAVRDLLEDKYYTEERFGDAISKIAFEDIIRMGDPDSNIDFEMWISRKVKLIQDMGFLGDEKITNCIIKSNNKELFLKYLRCFYYIEDAVPNEFIVDVGKRPYGEVIDQEFLLRIIFTTAEFETINELRGDLDYGKHQKLRNEKINQMLDDLGLQDDFNVKLILNQIEKERNQKAMDELLSNSPFKNSSLF